MKSRFKMDLTERNRFCLRTEAVSFLGNEPNFDTNTINDYKGYTVLPPKKTEE